MGHNVYTSLQVITWLCSISVYYGDHSYHTIFGLAVADSDQDAYCATDLVER